MRKILKAASSSPYELMVEIAGLVFTGLLLATTYSIFEYPLLRIVLFGIAGMVCALPFFVLCHFTNVHRRLGTILCLVIYFGGLIALFRLSIAGYYETGEGLMQWLVQDDENVDFSLYYTILLAVGGAAFFGTAVYYFTVIRYRMGMLVAISLLPCVLYAKAIADVNNWYLVLLAGINVTECILQRRYRRELELKAEAESFGGADVKGSIAAIHEKEGRKADHIMRGAMICGFVAAVLFVAAVIPKESDAKYYDLFEDTFLGGDISSEVMDVSGDLTEMSGNADGFRSVSNRRIYEVYGNDVSYLKRQTFDVYDFEKDRWTSLDDWGSTGYTDDEWELYAGNLNLQELQRAFRYADKISEGFAEKYGLENIVSADTIDYSQKTLNVRSLNFPAAYYITPQGTVSVAVNDFSTASVTWAGNFVRDAGKHDDNYNYTVYYRGTGSEMVAWCRLGGANMSEDECCDMFSELMDIYQQQIEAYSDAGDEDAAWELADSAEYKAVQAYAEQYAEACIYRDETLDNTLEISDRVKELAEEITEGCTYDWEKAQALQDYFHSGDFVYDIDYYAPDDSVEYFLFESKRGTCSDYATAYVLMARSLGMSVRYAEGYVAKSSGQRDLYYIRESNSHAFPEVYIQGTGWVIFEPTSGIVADSEDSWFNRFIGSIDMDYELMRTIAAIAIIIIILVLMIRLLIPAVVEAIFEIGLLSGRKNATDAYKRLIRKAASRKLRRKYRKLTGRTRFSEEKKPQALAPETVKEIYSEMNCDISVIIDEVDKAAYRTSYGNTYGSADSPDSLSKVQKKQLKKLRKNICRDYRRGKKIFTL